MTLDFYFDFVSPYAYLAWGLANDPRFESLARDTIQIIDLAHRLPLDALAVTLRSLHTVSGQYLDQSVRGGSQTDGPLLSRLEPARRQPDQEPPGGRRRTRPRVRS